MGDKSKIYTKKGDDGTTELLGGKRVSKYDIRLEAYGTVDELNAHIGLIRSCDLPDVVMKLLVKIQNKLFNIGSYLATDEKGKALISELIITEKEVNILEKAIDKFDSQLPKLTQFILPGGSALAAQCHVARTVCRRAERRIVEFSENNKIEPEIIRYLNRLSDLFFVMARKLNNDKGIAEMPWTHE